VDSTRQAGSSLSWFVTFVTFVALVLSLSSQLFWVNVVRKLLSHEERHKIPLSKTS
jgi:hypothetical protein